MNKKQSEIFRKLAGLFSEYDLKDINVALAAFRDEDLFGAIAEEADRTKRVKQRATSESLKKKSKSARERLEDLEREVAEKGSENQKKILLLSKRLLERETFSSISAIRKLFQDIDIKVGKTVTDRNRYVISLYTALKDQNDNYFREIERRMDEHTSQTNSLSDWSKLINRREDDD